MPKFIIKSICILWFLPVLPNLAYSQTNTARTAANQTPNAVSELESGNPADREHQPQPAINEIGEDLNDTQIPVITQDAEFYNPNEQLGNIKVIKRPDCNTPELFAKAMKAIEDYTQKIPAHSTLEKRNKALTLANIDGFERVEADNFTPEDDFNTANALITIKINKKIDTAEFLLCRQQGSLPNPLYLILYPYADNYKGHIINLDKTSSNYEDVTFIYP